MKIRTNHSGFAALEVALLLVVVAIIAFAGDKVYNSKKAVDQQNAENTSVNVPSSPSKISSVGDLTKAQQTLDQVNPDDSSSDLNQLNSQLTGF